MTTDAWPLAWNGAGIESTSGEIVLEQMDDSTARGRFRFTGHRVARGE